MKILLSSLVKYFVDIPLRFNLKAFSVRGGRFFLIRKKIIYKTKFVAMLAMIISLAAVANTNTQYQELLIPFIQNKGQIKQSQVDFYANTFGGTLFVTDDNELVYRLPYSGDAKAGSGWVFKESFINSNLSNARGEEKSGAKVSYFKGADAVQWKSNLPAFRRINLGELYQGIQVQNS